MSDKKKLWNPKTRKWVDIAVNPFEEPTSKEKELIRCNRCLAIVKLRTAYNYVCFDCLTQKEKNKVKYLMRNVFKKEPK